MTDDVIERNDGTTRIANEIYNTDTLSVLTDAFAAFQTMTTCCGNSNESVTSESQYNATKCHYCSLKIRLPVSLLELLLFNTYEDTN